jgi:hypothetical protein
VTEPAEPSKTPSDITHLLFKAVKGLPEEEQRAVFAYFFERGIGNAPPPAFAPFVREGAQLREMVERGAWPEPSSLATLFTTKEPMGTDRIMIPVRLSQAQHRRLKQWCAEHNFPMAVVVRGLVDRFLNTWDKRAA